MSELIQFEGCTVAVLAPEDLEELERDALRYKWMREYPDETHGLWVTGDINGRLREAVYGDELDAAIDAAYFAQEDKS